MTQYQYETIVKIIANGAPALATELCDALKEVILELNQLKEKSKEEKEETDAV